MDLDKNSNFNQQPDFYIPPKQKKKQQIEQAENRELNHPNLDDEDDINDRVVEGRGLDSSIISEANQPQHVDKRLLYKTQKDNTSMNNTQISTKSNVDNLKQDQEIEINGDLEIKVFQKRQPKKLTKKKKINAPNQQVEIDVIQSISKEQVTQNKKSRLHKAIVLEDHNEEDLERNVEGQDGNDKNVIQFYKRRGSQEEAEQQNEQRDSSDERWVQAQENEKKKQKAAKMLKKDLTPGKVKVEEEENHFQNVAEEEADMYTQQFVKSQRSRRKMQNQSELGQVNADQMGLQSVRVTKVIEQTYENSPGRKNQLQTQKSHRETKETPMDRSMEEEVDLKEEKVERTKKEVGERAQYTTTVVHEVTKNFEDEDEEKQYQDGKKSGLKGNRIRKKKAYAEDQEVQQVNRKVAPKGQNSYSNNGDDLRILGSIENEISIEQMNKLADEEEDRYEDNNMSLGTKLR